MGCDGGTIPKRDELVRTKKKPEQVSKEVDLLVKWEHCAMSQEPLRMPIVACELGRLFNKESIIEFLLEKSNHETASKFAYIRGIKDVKELQLTENPSFSASVITAKAGGDRKISDYICPITGLEMNGRYRFCYLLGCGCVFAERALNEIKDGSCVKCGKQYDTDDVIPLNGTDEDLQRLRKQMEQRRLLAKQQKKSKKGKDKCSAAATVTSENGHQNNSATNDVTADDSGEPIAKRQKLSTAVDSDVAKDHTVPSKSCEKSASGAMKTKDSAASVSRSVHTKPSSGSKICTGDQQKKSMSIQDDPRNSEAYKSLFSSHESAKRQPKAHWVTHNPLYF